MIGHELQHHFGTEVLSFRLIYSFHMPFFMFLSGMVFSLKFRDFPSQSLNISCEIIKSVCGLLIPFICWTIINAFLRYPNSMLSYFWKVIKSPDSSLWFLLVLFWCRIFFVMIHAVCIKPSVIRLASSMVIIFAVFSVVTKFFLRIGLPGLGNVLGIALFRMEFPYFAAGVFMYQYRERLSGFLDSIPANTAMLVMFVIFAPCWYLDSPNPAEMKLAEIFGEILYKIIKRVLPIPGVFLALSFTRLILRSDFKPIINALSFTGKKTLGIYTYHEYFRGMFFPPVILPLSAGIILTAITEKIPVVRSLLLGK